MVPQPHGFSATGSSATWFLSHMVPQPHGSSRVVKRILWLYKSLSSLSPQWNILYEFLSLCNSDKLQSNHFTYLLILHWAVVEGLFQICQLLDYGLNSLLCDYPFLLCISKAMSVNWSVSVSTQVLISQHQKHSVILACITRFCAEVVGAPWNPPPPPSRSSPQNFNLVSSYNSCKLELCDKTQVSVRYIHFHIGMPIKAVWV